MLFTLTNLLLFALQVNRCHAAPCQNGGTCSLTWATTDDYKCHCPAGFIGKNCEVNVDDCMAKRCYYGYCFDLVNEYKCICLLGFEGKNCKQVSFSLLASSQKCRCTI